MADAQSRRLAVLRGQLDGGDATADVQDYGLEFQQTFAEANIDFVHQYSVALPENLSTAGATSFQVRRC